MKTKLLFHRISNTADKRASLILLLIFDSLFVFINILQKSFVLSGLFLLVNLCYLIFSNNKNGLIAILFLYPFSRVLKFPSIETSILTILLPLFYIILIVRIIKNKYNSVSNSKLAMLFVYVFYIIYTFTVSLINKGGYEFSQLISYYVYLTLPVICVFTFTKDDHIDGSINIISISIGFLLSLLYTIFFYYVIPGGDTLLSNSGVNVFDMGFSGIRLSPLTDDPNYGTAIIAMVSALFFAIKKTKKQFLIGSPIIIMNIMFSALSVSKMFILCLLIILISVFFDLCFKIKNPIKSFSILFYVIILALIFLESKLGQSLLIRIVGNTDGVSLNRITTGRTELFGEYSSYVLSNTLTLFFGKGPIYSDLSIFTSGEHNTFTKALYGNGLIGVTLMLFVLYQMLKERHDGIKKVPNNIYFFSFIGCLLICCMSLSITPSNVFPFIVVIAQYASFKTETTNKWSSINI